MNTGLNLYVQKTQLTALYNQNRYYEYNAVNPVLLVERYVYGKWAARATAA
jgi:hypothetical protein